MTFVGSESSSTGSGRPRGEEWVGERLLTCE